MKARREGAVIGDRPSVTRVHADPGVPRTKEGTGVGLRSNAIHLGDCVKLLAEMDAESVDLAFAEDGLSVSWRQDPG